MRARLLKDIEGVVAVELTFVLSFGRSHSISEERTDTAAAAVRERLAGEVTE